MATVRLLGEDANPDIYQTLLQNYKTKAAELPQVSDAEIENAKQMQQYGTLANAVSKLVSSAGSFQGQQAKPMDFSEVGESGMRDVALKRQQQQDKLNLLNSEYGKDLQAQQAKDAMLASQAAARRQADMDSLTKAKIYSDITKEKLMPGEKKLDEDFAKDYNEWTSAGKAQADKNLTKLREAAQTLQNENLVSGRLVGSLPNFLRTEKSKVAEQSVREAAQAALKAVLGAQFTEKEGERIMRNAFDPTLSEAENLKKVTATIKELEERIANQNSKSRFFEQNRGSLRGWKTPSISPTENEIRTINGKQYRKVQGGWEVVN
jgi:hypothetical protein